MTERCSEAERLRIALEPLWLEALQDAGLRQDEVRLYPSLGAPERGAPWASFADPGDDLFELEGHRFGFTASDVDDSRCHKQIGQVALWAECLPIELLAIMRHELQHALQKRHDPAGYLANAMLGEALESVLGSDARRGLHEVLPGERDANAASARLIAARTGPVDARARRGPHAMLFTEPQDPPPRGVLRAPALAIAAVVPREFVAAYPHEVGNDMTADRLLNAMAELILGPKGREDWLRLTNSTEAREFRLQIIGAAQLGEQSAVSVRWNQLRQLLLAVERHGLSCLTSDTDNC